MKKVSIYIISLSFFALPAFANELPLAASSSVSPGIRPSIGTNQELQKRIAAKRTELKDRLKAIRDEHKREIVERIDMRMDELNANRMVHFRNVLDQLEKILGKIVTRADRAAVNGSDVTHIRAAVDSANASISAARTLLDEQSRKTYTIQISTDANLRTDVGKSRQVLHVDLRKIFDLLVAARDSVHDAATALAKTHSEESNSPSPSASSAASVSPSVSSSVSPSPAATQ